MTDDHVGRRIVELAPPADTRLRIWCLDLRPRPDDDVLALLDDEDRVSLERLDPVVRRRLLARRRLLGGIAARELGVEREQLVVERIGDRLTVGDRSGRRLHTSTSSSADLGLVVVGDGPVGIDVEVDADVPEVREMAVDLLHPDEARWIAAGPDLVERFLQVWVRKEAVVKVTGEGLRRDLRSFVVHPGVGVELVGGDVRIVTHGLDVPGAAAAVAWLT